MKTFKNKFLDLQSQAVPNLQLDFETINCPSFDDEPWKSKAEKLLPHRVSKFVLAEKSEKWMENYRPLRSNHRYYKLINDFLSSIPAECWIDEENEID